MSLFSGSLSDVTIKAFYSKIKAIYLQSANIFGWGGNLSDLDMITPYGTGCMPPKGISGVFSNVNGSGKKLVFIGCVNGIPEVPHEPVEGESWNNSQKYVLVQQNDGIRAYRIADEEFNATLPNGESVVKMMLNRINEMQETINTINANYDTLKNTFNNHTHMVTGVQDGGSSIPSNSPDSSLAQTDVTVYPTLGKDKSYLQEGKALINDTGEVYPE